MKIWQSPVMKSSYINYEEKNEYIYKLQKCNLYNYIQIQKTWNYKNM